MKKKLISLSVLACSAMLLAAGSFGIANSGIFGVKAEGMAGSGTVDDPYVIASADDWLTLKTRVESDDENASQEGIYYELGNDIETTAMIGSLDKAFAGNFDGKGNTITIHVKGEVPGKSGAGCFVTNRGIIHDLVVEGSFSYGERVGAITASNGGEIYNCVNNAEVAISGQYVGGICGVNGIAADNTTGKIHDCINNGAVYTICNNAQSSANGNCVGGIVGYDYCYAGTMVKDCINNGEIKGLGGVGGIIGWTKNTTVYTYTGLVNNGFVHMNGFEDNDLNKIGHIGGIIGMLGSKLNIDGCINTGNVDGLASQSSGSWRGVGGIAGSMFDGSLISNCFSSGNISANYMAAAIVGYTQPGTASTVSDNFATGVITVSVGNAGSIMGRGQKTAINNNICASTIINNGASQCGKVYGYGSAAITTSGNVEFEISENAMKVLGLTYNFECSDITEKNAGSINTALTNALAGLTGTDDATVLSMERVLARAGETYESTALYMQVYAASKASSSYGVLNVLFGINNENKGSSVAVISAVVLASIIITVLVIKRRKHA